jgi:membrane protein DedA with SNARE-associated domain
MITHGQLLYLLTHYGYGALAGLLAMGVFGLPVPDEFLLIFYGYLVYSGKMRFVPTITAAFIGSITGITVTYLIGVFVGRRAINSFGGRLGITEERLDTVHDWFNRFGKLAIPIGYFFPVIRNLTAFFAAISLIPYKEFAIYAYPGGLFWVTFFICTGWYLGKDWVLAKSLIHYFRYFGLGMLVLIVIGLIIWLLRHANNENRT